MRAVILAFFLLAGTAHADARDDAYVAGALDCATTATGLAAGLIEFNPLGPVLACALKPALIEAVSAQQEPERTHSLHTIEAGWDGVAAHNIAAVLGASNGVSLAIGGVVALVVWHRGAPAREFAAACATHKRVYPQTASLPCIDKRA